MCLFLCWSFLSVTMETHEAAGRERQTSVLPRLCVRFSGQKGASWVNIREKPNESKLFTPNSWIHFGKCKRKMFYTKDRCKKKKKDIYLIQCQFGCFHQVGERDRPLTPFLILRLSHFLLVETVYFPGNIQTFKVLSNMSSSPHEPDL